MENEKAELQCTIKKIHKLPYYGYEIVEYADGAFILERGNAASRKEHATFDLAFAEYEDMIACKRRGEITML